MGELRVATPGVCTKERRRMREDPSVAEVRRLSPGSMVGLSKSVLSRASSLRLLAHVLYSTILH
jgi:hypothetical protein